MVDRTGFDGDAIAAIISRESGFKPDAKNQLPGQTAVGLIQFTTTTLRGLGFNGTRDDFAELDDVEQLEFVERYFKRAFPLALPRRQVDYYLATWGAPAGLAPEHVLATKGDKLYEVNKGLDVNVDGEIRVADLDVALSSTIAKAGGQRLPRGEPRPKAEEGGSRGSESSPWPEASLPVLRPGVPGVAPSKGPAVELWRILLISSRYAGAEIGANVPELYDAFLEGATRAFQGSHGLTVDGVVGNRQTWPMMLRYMRFAAPAPRRGNG